MKAEDKTVVTHKLAPETVRDLFALSAMLVLLTEENPFAKESDIAQYAYVQADYMMSRKKEPY